MEKGNALALLPILKHAALSLSRVACFVGLSCVACVTAGTRIGSRRLVRGSPWLDARTGHSKHSLLGSAAFPVVSSGLCFRACLERVGERGWREAGESSWREFLERGWRERAVRECITLYICSRLTPIFHTVLNYSITGSRSQVVVW